MAAQSDKLPVKVSLVQRDRVDMVWAVVSPIVAMSQRRVANDVGLDEIRGDLINGGQQLWLITVGDKLTAVIITMIIQHPRRKILHLSHIAGMHMKVWLEDALDTMVEVAEKMGCSAIEANGRLGWSKHAAKLGFEEKSRVYEMELKHG
jgi:hypothetical protein